MGILNNMFRKSGGDSTQVVMTPLGKRKHDSYEADGAKLDVLVVLNDSDGVASIREICKKTRIDESKVKAIVFSMAKEGWAEIRQKGEGDI